MADEAIVLLREARDRACAQLESSPEFAATIAVSGQAIADAVLREVALSHSMASLHEAGQTAAHVLSRCGVPDQVSV